MTNDQSDGVIIGNVYRTPFEPSGLFRVLTIEQAAWPYGETAFGVFVGDHPCGYPDGSHGRYQVKELVGRQIMGAVAQLVRAGDS